MSDILSVAVLGTALIAALAMTMPLLIAALGETVGQRSGLLGLGLEGTVLLGAYVTYAVALGSGSVALGIVAGVGTGLVTAAVIALLSVVWGLDQVVVGIAVTLLGTGLTSVLYSRSFAETAPRLEPAIAVHIPGLEALPVIGPAIFGGPLLGWIAVLGTVVLAWMLRNSTWSLKLTAAGERPEALEAAGGSVMRIRVLAVLFSGACSGLAGAYLVVVSTGAFTAGMTAGIGYIAIVVAMLGRGRVLTVVVISLGYGLIVAIGTLLQLAGIALPSDVIALLPYIAVLAALVIGGRRGVLPAALGRAYHRGER